MRTGTVMLSYLYTFTVAGAWRGRGVGSDVLAATREAQGFRSRTQGVSSIGLATGEKLRPEEEAELGSTGWSLKTGGDHAQGVRALSLIPALVLSSGQPL